MPTRKIPYLPIWITYKKYKNSKHISNLFPTLLCGIGFSLILGSWLMMWDFINTVIRDWTKPEFFIDFIFPSPFFITDITKWSIITDTGLTLTIIGSLLILVSGYLLKK